MKFKRLETVEVLNGKNKGRTGYVTDVCITVDPPLTTEIWEYRILSDGEELSFNENQLKKK